MSQNPYAQPGGYEVPPEPARTSIMAILSLVCSIVCIPGLGVLGVVLAIASLFAISGSRGRLAGKGIAISGLIVGMLFTCIWVGAFVLVLRAQRQFGTVFVPALTSVFTSIDQGDFQKARVEMGLAGSVTDEEFQTFRAAYQAQAGTFVSMPDRFIPLASLAIKASTLMNTPPPLPGSIPMPADFTKGVVVIFVQVQPGRAATKGAPLPPILNMGIRSAPGVETWLIPAPGTAAPKPSATSAPPSPGAPPPPPGPPGGNGGG